jgi:hypothetical protein
VIGVRKDARLAGVIALGGTASVVVIGGDRLRTPHAAGDA